MIRNDLHWLSLTDAFFSAAIGSGDWYPALAALADATGSRVGELVCFGPDATVPVNIMTNVDPAFHPAFVAAGGGDPRINPRLNAGMNAPVMKVLAEADFVMSEDYRPDPDYEEFMRRWDVPFTCLVTLERTRETLIGLAVARTRREGHISDGERDVFEALAPHVRSAVRTQMALEGQGAELLTGALEAMSIPAFVCDSLGEVRELTPAAEKLVLARRGIQLRQRQLHATHPADAKPLKDAISAILYSRYVPGSPTMRTVVLHDEDQPRPSLVLDVIALPSRPFEFTFAPRVLIIARGERGTDGRRAAALQAAYALTAAETDIAVQLSRGLSAEAIAASRGVSLATVRTQIKAIMAKFGVSRQIELALKVHQF